MPVDERVVYRRLVQVLGVSGKLDELIVELGLDEGNLTEGSAKKTIARQIINQMKARIPPELDRLASHLGLDPNTRTDPGPTLLPVPVTPPLPPMPAPPPAGPPAVVGEPPATTLAAPAGPPGLPAATTAQTLTGSQTSTVPSTTAQKILPTLAPWLAVFSLLILIIPAYYLWPRPKEVLLLIPRKGFADFFKPEGRLVTLYLKVKGADRPYPLKSYRGQAIWISERVDQKADKAAVENRVRGENLDDEQQSRLWPPLCLKPADLIPPPLRGLPLRQLQLEFTMKPIGKDPGPWTPGEVSAEVTSIEGNRWIRRITVEGFEVSSEAGTRKANPGGAGDP